MEKFKRKYRIDVGDSKGPQTRYATSDNWTEIAERMTKTFREDVLKIFVYAPPQGTKETDNKGKYIPSSFCTAVAAEMKARIERNEEV